MHLENLINPYTFLPLGGKRAKNTNAKRKILIVDDDQEMAEVVKSCLEQNKDFEIKMASDPYEAINLLLDEVYDFLLLDWNLPKMNGLKTILEAEKIFRHDPTLPLDWESRKVGVITFSGESTEDCKLPTTRHFKYIGHVSKGASLKNIVSNMQHYFDGPYILAY
jgi:PleD family two-component response regulator